MLRLKCAKKGKTLKSEKQEKESSVERTSIHLFSPAAGEASDH